MTVDYGIKETQMPGTTGKRARPAGICLKCGQQIKDCMFMRDRKGDYHATMPDGSSGCPKAPNVKPDK